jgi:hypothetical protein
MKIKPQYRLEDITNRLWQYIGKLSEEKRRKFFRNWKIDSTKLSEIRQFLFQIRQLLYEHLINEFNKKGEGQ